MKIGVLINQFDNTLGTVQDFNEIFIHCPLGPEFDPNAIVYIDVPKVGNQHVRRLRINSGNHSVLLDHEFRGNLPPKKEMLRVTIDGESRVFNSKKEAADYYGVNFSTVSRWCIGDLLKKNVTVEKIYVWVIRDYVYTVSNK